MSTPPPRKRKHKKLKERKKSKETWKKSRKDKKKSYSRRHLKEHIDEEDEEISKGALAPLEYGTTPIRSTKSTWQIGSGDFPKNPNSADSSNEKGLETPHSINLSIE